jgi:hypothetical protein
MAHTLAVKAVTTTYISLWRARVDFPSTIAKRKDGDALLSDQRTLRATVKTGLRSTARRTMVPFWLNFGLPMAVCTAQCLNLEREFHHAASKLCVLGFEPLK